jgi:hypothetical protein
MIIFWCLLQNIISPSSLKNVISGARFSWILDGAMLLSSLQIITVGAHFNQSLESVLQLSNLKRVTSCGRSNQSGERDAAEQRAQHRLWHLFQPELEERDASKSSVQIITFGGWFNQSLETHVTSPSSLLCLSFGDRFDQNLEIASPQNSLWTVHFDACSDQRSPSWHIRSELPAILSIGRWPVNGMVFTLDGANN